MQEYSEEGVVEALTIVRAKGFDLNSRVQLEDKECVEGVFTLVSTTQTSVLLEPDSGEGKRLDVQKFLADYVLAVEPALEKAWS